MRNPRIELKSRLNIITKGILLSSLALTGACFTASAEEANKPNIKEGGVERITISAGKKVESVQNVDVAVTLLNAVSSTSSPTDETEKLASSTLDAYRVSALYEGRNVELYKDIHGGKQKFLITPIEHFGLSVNYSFDS
jgi:hypothetical protein